MVFRALNIVDIQEKITSTKKQVTKIKKKATTQKQIRDLEI